MGSIIDAPVGGGFDVGVRLHNLTDIPQTSTLIATGGGKKREITKTLPPFSNESVLLSTVLPEGVYALRIGGKVTGLARFGQTVGNNIQWGESVEIPHID